MYFNKINSITHKTLPLFYFLPNLRRPIYHLSQFTNDRRIIERILVQPIPRHLDFY